MIVCTFRILKILASLLSPTAFALGTVNFADYERAHVGVRWSNIWQVDVLCKIIFILFLLYIYVRLSSKILKSISVGFLWSEFFGLPPYDDA